jgi:predicted DNA-binding ribbon-helix-helix protein
MVDTKKHSVIVAGHATSISLEPIFWEEITEIAQKRGISVNALISEIDQGRTGTLSAAVRVYVLQDLRRRARI